MTSKAVSQNAFLDPQDEAEGIPKEGVRVSRKATVYDAVAGRISATGFIPKETFIAAERDTHSSSTVPVAPESVLFRAKNAPPRYHESDFYFANERNPELKLPESDLLKALHCYTSDFYARATAEATIDWQSMDESALLAFGILLEESAREMLGRTGDLVFTEGEENEIHVQAQPSRGKKTSGVIDRGSAKRRRLQEFEDS